MTILGAHVLAPDLAVTWSDSEGFIGPENRTAGFAPKLVVNAAGFAFVMAGWGSVASRAGACVMDAPDFATALARLPGVLRRASEQAAVNSREPDAYGYQHAALIGFDHRAGAMTAHRFAAQECFVPLLDHDQMVPRPAMISGTLQPIGSCQVRLIAERQMECLRRSIPHARGGPLHVAVIRPGSVTIERLCDLTKPEPTIAPEPEKEPALVH